VRVEPGKPGRLLSLSKKAGAAAGKNRSAVGDPADRGGAPAAAGQSAHDARAVVNHKRVERIMREDNLLALRWRKFVTTTDAAHDRPVYVNLAGRMELSGLNQLWVADITYIR
jgi:transposase InsO family protein